MIPLVGLAPSPRARRVKQTCRWHVCSQSGEQAVLATWARLSPPQAAVTEGVRGSNGVSCSPGITCAGQDPFLFRSGRKRNGSWTPKRKASRGGVPCTPRYGWECDAFYSRPKLRAGRYPDVPLCISLRDRPHIPTLARPAKDWRKANAQRTQAPHCHCEVSAHAGVAIRISRRPASILHNVRNQRTQGENGLPRQ